MLQEMVKFLKLDKYVFDARVALLRGNHKILQHLCFVIQVLSLLTVEVIQVHVLNAQISLQLGHSLLHQLEVFAFYLKWTLIHLILTLLHCVSSIVSSLCYALHGLLCQVRLLVLHQLGLLIFDND